MARLSIPNALSFSRCLAGVALLWPLSPPLRLSLIVWGAVSDFLDGFTARRLQRVTESGALLDLISDGIFFVGALVGLWEASVISTTWLIVIILVGGAPQLVAQAIRVRRRLTVGSTGHWLSKTLGGVCYAFVIGATVGVPVGYLAPPLVILQLAANGRDIVESLR